MKFLELHCRKMVQFFLCTVLYCIVGMLKTIWCGFFSTVMDDGIGYEMRRRKVLCPHYSTKIGRAHV